MLGLRSSAATYLNFDATVLRILPRTAQYPTAFTIRSNVTGAQRTCWSNLSIPLYEGDVIIGTGRIYQPEDEKQPGLLLTEMPTVRPDVTKEGLIRLIVARLKGVRSFVKARAVYEWLEQALSVGVASPYLQLAPDDDLPTTIPSWLDHTTHLFVTKGHSALEQDLTRAFPEAKIRNFLGWWYKHSSRRRLLLIGLDQRDVRALTLDHNKAYEILLYNPYLITTISLETAARVLTITKNTKVTPQQRRCGEIARILVQHLQKYNWSCSPLSMLKREIKDLAEHQAELMTALFPRSKGPRGYGCVHEFDSLYLPYPQRIEEKLAALLISYNRPIITPEPIYDQLQPSPDQHEAVKLALSQGVSALYGRGGCGKTTIMTFIQANLNLLKKSWIALSFTGRAVARIREVTKSEEVYTLHSALRKDFPRVTVALIDECSMVESALLYEFLSNHPNITHLVFFGDPRQLLPIGWGSFFIQYLASNLPKAELTQQHRQKQSTLSQALQCIIDYQPTPALEHFKMVEGNYTDVLQAANDLHSQGVQFVVLCPLNKPIDDLNKDLREICNADSPRLIEPKTKREWRLGDRVMMTENCHDINVMNGDEGEVVDLGDDSIDVLFQSGRKTLPFTPLRQLKDDDDEDDLLAPNYAEKPLSTALLQLAWALTIHKSQGGEHQAVIIYLPDQLSASGFFCNNMAYVASSRAKEQVIVVGAITTWQQAIATHPPIRHEHLTDRVLTNSDGPHQNE